MSVNTNMATQDSSSDVFDRYLGTWKIVEWVSLAGVVDQESAGIEGAEFRLDEGGDVSWKVSEEMDTMPFFSSDTYEFVMTGSKLLSLKFFGTFAEHVIEFKAEIQDDLMLLTCERCCMLQCQKVANIGPKLDEPYSFASALEEGYFTDMVIKADSAKEFRVHSLILGIAAPEMDWTCSPPPLSGLQEDVLKTVLYYLYTSCLPRGLSEETAKKCISKLGKLPGLANFSQLCETFLKNTALKQQIISLIDEVHTSADRIIDLLKCKKPAHEGAIPEDALACNPPKLCYVMKQITREGAIACSKLVIVCDLFARRSGELPQEERHGIIKYARSRLPVFIKQLREFFEAFKYQVSFMEATQKREIATYLLPEIETSLNTITKFIEEFKSALDQAISIAEKEKSSSKGEKHKKDNVKDVLGKTLRHALHIKELKKLKQMHETASLKFEVFLGKMSRFKNKSEADKISKLVLFLDNLKDREATLLVGRLEQLAQVMEDKFKWREWKYLFKLGSSKVAWAVNKLCNYRMTLQSPIKQMIDMVNKEEFTASINTLGLIADPKYTNGATEEVKDKKPSKKDKHNKAKYVHLSSVESLCVPPNAKNSMIAKRALELLKKKEKTDLVFEIILVHDQGDIVIDHTHGEPIERSETERDVDVYEIPAHCVILASRCNWFSRALQSGMRESIDKKIAIHDTNPEVFSLFLEYLYSGQLKLETFSTEQLTDLLALGDRYEVDTLKLRCEQALQQHVDTDTALYLFSLADQLHTKSLKDRSLNYVVKNPSLTEGEMYSELPDHLKSEVENALAAGGCDIEPSAELPIDKSSSQTYQDVVKTINSVSISDESTSSSSSSTELLQMIEDPELLQSCVTSLREVVGNEASDDELIRIIMSADYDVNRAINFYYSLWL